MSRLSRAKLVKTLFARHRPVPSARRWRPWLESLENRLAPAAATNLFLDVGPLINNVAAARSNVVPVYVDVGSLAGGAGGFKYLNVYIRIDEPLTLNYNTVAPGAPGSDIKLGSL